MNNTTQFDEDKMNIYTNLYLFLLDSAVHYKLNYSRHLWECVGAFYD